MAAAVDEKKKYKALENVLIEINKKYISLSDEERARNNIILKELLDLLTTKMKQKNNLFNEMYTRVFYGGSFYDGLRVGQPNEFDLDLLLTLPKLVNPDLTTSNIPGYVHLQLKDLPALPRHVDMAKRFKGLDKLVDKNHYLDNQKVRAWMETVVNVTLNEFELQGGKRVLRTQHGTFFFAKIYKSGPAFTLKVNGNVGGKDISLDVDLVPCFEFTKNYWPPYGFRANPVNYKPNFFIVPKPLKNSTPVNHRYWRLSFQEQERELIDGKQNLKPSIKLMKKMRDTLDHKCIASYYIKTTALWENEKMPPEFWRSSLSYVFMTVLKDYYENLRSGKILYFWYKTNNLLKDVKIETLSNMANRLKRIIDDIDRHLDDSTVVAKYILTPQEYDNFMKAPPEPEVRVESNCTCS